MKINGLKLFSIRRSKDISRTVLGAFLGVSGERVRQLEKEGEHDINPHVLKALAKKLGVKPEELQ